MLKKLLIVVMGTAIISLMSGSGHAFKDNIVAGWTFDEGSGNAII